MKRSTTQYEGDMIELLAEVKNDQTFQEFINQQLRKKTLVSLSYKALLLFICGVLLSIYQFQYSSEGSTSNFLFQLGLGVLLGLLLIPIHESIHGIYLKALGSGNVKFEWDILRFRFDCYSDKFVLTKLEYYRLLLAPAIVVTFVLLVLSLIFSQFLVVFLAMILMHSALCAGDVALVNHLSYLREEQLFIYYDADYRKTIFLAKK